MSNSPVAISLPCGNPALVRYCTSLKPSACKSSSAMNCGATQVAGVLMSLSLVVSGGGSAPSVLAGTPNSPAVPASVRPLTNCRRVKSMRQDPSFSPVIWAGWLLRPIRPRQEPPMPDEVDGKAEGPGSDQRDEQNPPSPANHR